MIIPNTLSNVARQAHKGADHLQETMYVIERRPGSYLSGELTYVARRFIESNNVPDHAILYVAEPGTSPPPVKSRE